MPHLIYKSWHAVSFIQKFHHLLQLFWKVIISTETLHILFQLVIKLHEIYFSVENSLFVFIIWYQPTSAYIWPFHNPTKIVIVGDMRTEVSSSDAQLHFTSWKLQLMFSSGKLSYRPIVFSVFYQYTAFPFCRVKGEMSEGIQTSIKAPKRSTLLQLWQK